MTGRGAGFCAGYGVPGFKNTIPVRSGMGFGRGCGRGFGMGMGMGWRHGWNYQQATAFTISLHDELSVLKDQAKYFGEALQSINSRISELETEKK